MQKQMRSDAFLAAAMEACGDAVYRLALCRLGSRADAEDVYQETFLRLLRDDTEFADAEHLKAWLLRVALSRCADLRRSAWFKRTAPLEAAPDAASPEQEMHDELRQAVRALPDDQRTVVWLHRGLRHGRDRVHGELPPRDRADTAAPREETTEDGFGGILR